MAGTMALNLKENQRAQRKLLITVASWKTDGNTFNNFEVLGIRTEDSSIEFNIDSETSTDILGNSWSDVNKTEPQQDLDPHYIVGGSKLDKYLTEAALRNRIDDYNAQFNIYIIAAYINDGSTPGETTGATKFYTVKHSNCSIFPTAIGGDNYTSLPIEVHFSNTITPGYVNSITGINALSSEGSWFTATSA